MSAIAVYQSDALMGQVIHTPLTINRNASNGGEQITYRFANGYGASVVRSCRMPYGLGATYGAQSGLWELAVVKFTGPLDDDWHLVYDTPITDDVIGRLTEDDVEELLSRIKAL